MFKNLQNVGKSQKLNESQGKRKSGISRRGINSSSSENPKKHLRERDSTSPLLFVIAMMPLVCILWKCTEGNKFTKSKEKLNRLIYREYIKIFAKK